VSIKIRALVVGVHQRCTYYPKVSDEFFQTYLFNDYIAFCRFSLDPYLIEYNLKYIYTKSKRIKIVYSFWWKIDNWFYGEASNEKIVFTFVCNTWIYTYISRVQFLTRISPRISRVRNLFQKLKTEDGTNFEHVFVFWFRVYAIVIWTPCTTFLRTDWPAKIYA